MTRPLPWEGTSIASTAMSVPTQRMYPPAYPSQKNKKQKNTELDAHKYKLHRGYKRASGGSAAGVEVVRMYLVDL